MAKYLVMSDLHLGQSGRDAHGQYSLLSQVDSALTKQRSRAQATQSALARRVAEFAGDDGVTLVAVGDLLDLSLAYLKDALADLGALLALLEPVSRLIWVVGNHDHHIWMLHSEESRVLTKLRAGQEPLAGSAYDSTEPDCPEPCALLQPWLARAVERDVAIDLAYPSLRLELSDNAFAPEHHAHGVGAYFTHGHLFGGIYTAMSGILQTRLAGLQAERRAATVNLALIELIFWLLGETGQGMGADGLVESVYTDLQRGNASRLSTLIDKAIAHLMPAGFVPMLPDRWERKAFKTLALRLLRKATRDVSPTSSRDRHGALSQAQQRAQRWLVDVAELPRDQRMIAAYGHTHRADLHGVSATNIAAYNLGSWLVEPGHADPDTQLLMIDEGRNKLEVQWEWLPSGSG